MFLFNFMIMRPRSDKKRSNSSDRAATFALLRRIRLDKRGSPAVEMALSAPLLVALMLGTVELGNFFYVQHNMLLLAGEFAREISVGALTDEEADAAVASRLGHWSEAVAVDITDGAAEDFTLSISVPMSDVSLTRFFGFIEGAQLSASATMRRQS